MDSFNDSDDFHMCCWAEERRLQSVTGWGPSWSRRRCSNVHVSLVCVCLRLPDDFYAAPQLSKHGLGFTYEHLCFPVQRSERPPCRARVCIFHFFFDGSSPSHPPLIKPLLRAFHQKNPQLHFGDSVCQTVKMLQHGALFFHTFLSKQDGWRIQTPGKKTTAIFFVSETSTRKKYL